MSRIIPKYDVQGALESSGVLVRAAATPERWDATPLDAVALGEAGRGRFYWVAGTRPAFFSAFRSACDRRASSTKGGLYVRTTMALVSDWRLDRHYRHHLYRHWQHGGSQLAAAAHVLRHSAGDVAVALERRSTAAHRVAAPAAEAAVNVLTHPRLWKVWEIASDLLIATALIWTLPLLLGVVGAVVRALLEAR